MIHLREAMISDNSGLLNLTSSSPMDGKISIRIDRYPDFFSLLNLRGPGKLIVAEKEGKIIGCISLSIMDVNFNGSHEKINYVADLKVHPAYTGTTLAARLLNHMYSYLKEIKADLVFSTAAMGNNKVMPLMNGRIGLPENQCVGIFRVYQIIPFRGKKRAHHYIIDEVPLDGKITGLYKDFLKRYRVSPLLNEKSLQGSRHFVAMMNNEIKASISLIDLSASKQNVLISLPFTLNLLISSVRKFNNLIKIINLPGTGEQVRIMYIKFFAFREGYEDALDILVNHARKLCYHDDYCFLTVGIHEKDPLSSFFSRYLHFTFNSLGFIASLNNDKVKLRDFTSGPIYEDYSLV